MKHSSEAESYGKDCDASGDHHRSHNRRAHQLNELTRNQILHYVAELSAEMSALANQVECAVLADHLMSVSAEARDQLPKGFEG